MDYQLILEFWFGLLDKPDYGKPQKQWFIKNPEFDRQVRSQFLETYQQAAAGKLDRWKELPLSCLALIILLDQFPRNMFRGQVQAFATDEQALYYAKYAVEQGYDQHLLPVQRWFIYLPFEHSENLAEQHRNIQLISTLKNDLDSTSAIDYAYRHLEIIQRFGRFPHRNVILGRFNTPEEEDFLKQPGSSF